MRVRVSLLIVSLVLCLNTGCTTPSKALWRAGASRYGFEEVSRPMPKASSDVEVFYKGEFGAFEEIESKRFFACSTTTVLRKSFLLERPVSAPTRDYEALAHVTTEEFPRDEERSEIDDTGEFFTLFTVGTVPMDLFEVQLDPAFHDEAVDRLKYFASQLGADAVVDVFATGEAEYHMWQGFGLGLNSRETHSFVLSFGRVLEFRLRDVRLHGTAVRYAN